MTLADAVLSLEPIEARLGAPLAFSRRLGLSAQSSGPGLSAAQLDVLPRLFDAAGLRAPRWVDPTGLSVFDKIALDALALAEPAEVDFAEPQQAIAQARVRGIPRLTTGSQAERRILTATDGVALSALYLGQLPGTPFLVFGAPGTPFALISGWLRGLGARRRVATFETRGLFGPGSAAVESLGIGAQLADARTVMDNADWREAHVLGICGGAALALAYAAEHPERVRSLSLWFGDYELGSLSPKTDHQRNLVALMQMAVSQSVPLPSLHSVLLQVMTKLSEPNLAPLALYPYATPELLGQYCRMNHPIMSTDCTPSIDRTRAPSLVVFSPEDLTTHPEGSRIVAERLRAGLVSVPSLGHLHAFRGRESDLERALRFHLGHD